MVYRPYAIKIIHMIYLREDDHIRYENIPLVFSTTTKGAVGICLYQWEKMLDNEKIFSYPYSSDSRKFCPVNHFRTGCLFGPGY